MAIFFKADTQTTTLISNVITKYHQQLQRAQIIVGVLFALSNKEDKPALKEAGYPVDGVIKIVPLKDRITKGFDVEMILDADSWKGMNEKSQSAFVDHLLSRLELKKPKVKKNKDEDDNSEDSGVEFSVDDIGRPILKIKKCDWNAGFGFRDVVQRHGINAPECYHVMHAKSIIDSIIKTE